MQTTSAPTPPPPKDWFIAGDKPHDYEVSLDRTTRHSGKASGTIRSISEPIQGFGTLMQQASPDGYLGKRVRLTGWVRTRDVKLWAGLWLRVDGPKGNTLAIDNMQARPLKGTLDWTMCEIVLDVSSEAVLIAYGVLVCGTGQAWLDDLAFEIVGPEVPLTQDCESPSFGPPSNLDFEE